MQEVSVSQCDAPVNSADNSMPRLRRVLTLKDLITDFVLSQSSSTSKNHDREPLVI